MRWSKRRRALTIGAIALSLVSPRPAAPATSSDLPSLAELLPSPSRVHPDIAAQVDVDLSGMRTIATRLADARLALSEATGREVVANGAIARLTQTEQRLRGRLAETLVDFDVANEVLREAEADLAVFAVATFVESSALDLSSFEVDTAPDDVPMLAGSAEDVILDTRDRAADVVADIEQRRDLLTTQIADTVAEAALQADALRNAEADAAAAADDIARLEPTFEAAVMSAPVEGGDFPLVVLEAYYRAALRTAEVDPACGVRWDQLAGIGRVESHQGTYGGTSEAADGRTVGEILGPVLDGTRFASIPDTDGGSWDGDTVWDRAVGPMQFIPGSWKRYGADGNNDGEVDPHNMYDAALAAARHLCGSASDLGDDANYQRALLGYNRSAPYGVQVMGHAAAYRAAVGLESSPSSVSDPEVVEVSSVSVRPAPASPATRTPASLLGSDPTTEE